MPEDFLYEELDTLSKHHFINQDLPDSIRLNLNPKFELRQYQVEAFSRFLYCYKNEHHNYPLPLNLLFNMATGSGKTLIMAGSIHSTSSKRQKIISSIHHPSNFSSIRKSR